MNRPLKWAVAAVAALGLGFALLWALLRTTNGFSARAEPPEIEKSLARRVRRLALPAKARDAQNPVAPTPVALARARAYFADHCAVCHANDGRGGTEIGQRLYPRVPDMAGPETQALTDGEIFHAIRYGIRLTGMPAWGGDDAESDEDVWKLVHLIRHLPKLTEVEREEIRRLAPKTPEEWQAADEERRLLEAEGGAGRFAPFVPPARPSPAP